MLPYYPIKNFGTFTAAAALCRDACASNINVRYNGDEAAVMCTLNLQNRYFGALVVTALESEFEVATADTNVRSGQIKNNSWFGNYHSFPSYYWSH